MQSRSGIQGIMGTVPMILYSSKPEDLGGLRVRDWLNGKDYDFQYHYGLDVLKKYGY